MFSDKEFLKHILEEIEFLEKECANLDYDHFLQNTVLRKAAERSIEIIGEASKKISKTFRDSNPTIDWRGMAGTRDKLIHDYFGVDHEILWDIIQNFLPKLKTELEKLLT